MENGKKNAEQKGNENAEQNKNRSDSTANEQKNGNDEQQKANNPLNGFDTIAKLLADYAPLLIGGAAGFGINHLINESKISRLKDDINELKREYEALLNENKKLKKQIELEEKERTKKMKEEEENTPRYRKESVNYNTQENFGGTSKKKKIYSAFLD